ncbi:MAG TPA: hypothetical protein VM692_12285 [Gammaproteobacteria bacterium]|nr:hypothetical protein [Gammaproteobacteria bacterium]
MRTSPRHFRTSFATLFALAALLAACSGEAQPPVHPLVMTSVSPAHCVQALTSGGPADLIRCPAPLRDALAEAMAVCKDAGGTLVGIPEGDVWSLDVNGDGRQELLFEIDSNVGCEGAFSIFSCGSLGCPKALYELRNGAWTVVGSLSAVAPENVTLARTAASDGHRALEVCAQQNCTELWTYEWRDSMYETTRLKVRGAGVDFAGSIHGLYPLAAATTVRATPAQRGAEVGNYDARTEVAIIGTAEGADYYYVSPCNACESGFVPRSAITVP